VLIFFCQAYAFYATSQQTKAHKGLRQPHFLSARHEVGNGNQGLTHGTQLSKEDREKMLEYLKTL
jgi:hypothetical protein